MDRSFSGTFLVSSHALATTLLGPAVSVPTTTTMDRDPETPAPLGPLGF